MNRTISDLLVILAVILLLAVYGTSGWLSVPHEGSTALSVLPAVGTLIASFALLYLVNERLLSGSSLLAGSIYIILACADPASLSYTPLHAASLLIAVSLSTYLHFNSVSTSMGNLTVAWATLGAAALIVPPLAWLVPVYAVTSVGKTEEKLKFWTAALLSLLLPLAAWTGICYLRGGDDPMTILQSLWNGMCAIQGPSLNYPAATVCRMLLVTIATVLAIISILFRLDSFKTALYHAYFRLILLTLALGILSLLFFIRPGLPFGLLTALTTAPLLGEYFSHPERKKGKGTLIIVLVLVLVVERISYFVNL